MTGEPPLTITAKEYQAMHAADAAAAGAARKSKYKARKTPFAGRTFDSKKEAKRYAELLQLQQTGLIAELECQPQYDIVVNGILVCRVLPDFRYRDLGTGRIVVEDTKNPATAENRVFRLKAKLLKAVYGIEVRVV